MSVVKKKCQRYLSSWQLLRANGPQSSPGGAFWQPAQDVPQNPLEMWEREVLIMSIHPTLIQDYSGGVNSLTPAVLCLRQSSGQTLAGIL